MKFSGCGILLDIEGTTSSVSFVYDVMFPFVRRELDEYLCANWGSAALNEVCDLIAKDAGYESFIAWCGNETEAGRLQQLLREEVFRLMDGDVKATGLKALQGLIWQSGFESGEMRAHIYDDVLPAIQAWNDIGCDVRIFSSGSIAAQKLFFGAYRDRKHATSVSRSLRHDRRSKKGSSELPGNRQRLRSTGDADSFFKRCAR